MTDFSRQIVAWQRRHGRHDLPWQGTRDPYRIWVSEIMLQQTQVAAVIAYYARFMARFPDLQSLATATQDEVLELWSGLGYYARARNLHQAARILVQAHGGRFPATAEAIATLPGIGRSTAAAIAVFAYGQRTAILDGNVKRVLTRRFGIEGFPGKAAVESVLWELAGRLVPRGRGREHIEAYTQGLMDLGATVCTRGQPACEDCPLSADCVARKSGRTAQLPAARPRKAYPTRQSTWLVLHYRGEVLLERRPSSGLWGGLLVFPEFGGGELADYCRRELGCQVEGHRSLAPFVHGFTHFRLEISPLVCEVTRRASKAESSGRVWRGLNDAIDAAVPVPVRKVLRAL